MGIYCGALDPYPMLFAAIFNINSMAMARPNRDNNLHILATKLNVLLYFLAFVTGAASIWRREGKPMKKELFECQACRGIFSKGCTHEEALEKLKKTLETFQKKISLLSVMFVTRNS